EVKESLSTSKLISMEFLPPYSPFLNPIEYSFHSIKAFNAISVSELQLKTLRRG
ncbi:hypothetical protein VP01_4329g1, partial [Puccinia sorghi]